MGWLTSESKRKLAREKRERIGMKNRERERKRDRWDQRGEGETEKGVRIVYLYITSDETLN